MRAPYEKDRGPRYSHDEQVGGRDSSEYLWGSALWPIAAQLAHAFSAGSWCADLSANTNSRVSQGFPSVRIRFDEGDFRRRGPLEIAFSDSALYQLRNSGFTALSSDAGTNRILIEQPQTLYRGPAVPSQASHAAHLLRDTIGRGRLEQYLLSIARELRGRSAGPDQFLRIVNHWVESNFPGNALRLAAFGDDGFVLEGDIVAPGSTASFHISVPVRLHPSQFPDVPDSYSSDSQPDSPSPGILEEVKPYFELLRQSAELRERGLISVADQESIKRSILRNVHSSLGDSPGPYTGRMHSPAPLLGPATHAKEERSRVYIGFDSAQTTSAGDYAILLGVIEDVHSLLCSHSFEIERIHRASPGEIFGATICPGCPGAHANFFFRKSDQGTETGLRQSTGRQARRVPKGDRT